MTAARLRQRLVELAAEPLPLPGHGHTALRHRQLFSIAREDLSLSKLAEAHFDALAMLAEAGRQPHPNAIYAVWASEIPGHALTLTPCPDGSALLSGTKPFCSGAGLLDRALVTALSSEPGSPPLLVDIDLRAHPACIAADTSAWATEAFRLTNTGAITFSALPVAPGSVVGPPGFYLDRPGFWHGACGPAACWAGGVAGLLDAALHSRRDDPHTVAHLAAMHANIWALQSLLDTAGNEIDQPPPATASPDDIRRTAQRRALTLRHLVEQLSTDTLRRFARAFGPHPLAMDAETGRRYAEADLFLRQCHGERDLEALGRLLRP